jgi:hypothetical protein
MVGLDGAPCPKGVENHLSPTRNRKFADSPLEESGFEPLVPPSESAQPRHRPDLADCYTVTRLALQGDRFARAGPGVRIRFAPGKSLVRTSADVLEGLKLPREIVREPLFEGQWK